jgi:hypothetical protein
MRLIEGQPLRGVYAGPVISFRRLHQRRRSPALCLAMLFIVVSLSAAPSLAATGKTASIGAKSAVEGLGSCRLEANGQPGEPENESALNVHSGGIPDDGTLTKWSFIGTAGGNAKVFLDIFEPGFAMHPNIEKQIASPYDEFQDATVSVEDSIPVVAGQGLGVTVTAGPNSQTEANVASVLCISSANFQPGSFLDIWEAPLKAGLVPNKEGTGEVSVQADRITYDEPVVESVTPESGPAAGGTEVTIKGKHLANASVAFPEGAVKAPGQTPASEDTEVKVITPEEVAGAPAEGVLSTYFESEKKKFKYTYTGTPRSRTPQIVLEPFTNLTETSVELHATVNIEGLVTSPEFIGTRCEFGYGSNEVEEGEEGECDPLPEPFSESAQPVSAQLHELVPGTTYHYFLAVRTKYGLREGFAETNDEASFKTLGAGGAGGGEVEAPAKELSAVLPVPTSTTTASTTSTLKGLMALIPAAGLVGGSSLTATPTGAVPVKVSCPVGESSCTGSITLKTIGAVTANVGSKAKKAVLTLATGSFKVLGGKTSTVQLHLSAKARALLKRIHTLHARATIVAHDNTGAQHTTVATVTIRARKAKH